jgi:glycosyltransferase involved in cell wall biosynthesis
MACGKPVVASSVGVNVEIVDNWQCGLLADGAEQWFRALANLIGSPDTRREFGQHGRRAVEQRYSLQAQAPRMARLLRGVAETV